MAGPRAIPLALRLALIYAMLVTATLLVVAGLTVHLTRAHLIRTLDQRLVSVVRSFQEGPAGRGSEPEIMVPRVRAWLAAQASSRDEVIAVRFATGPVLTTSGGIELRGVSGARDLLTASRSGWWTLRAEGGPIRAVTVPILQGHRQIATLVVAGAQGGVAATLAAILSGVVWASAIGLAFALLIALAAVRGAFGPLGGMVRQVDRIQQTGDLSLRVGYEGPRDEVGRLAESFDRMLSRLEGAFRSQRRFLADASHELRTPLAVARGHLELLEHEQTQAGGRRSIAIAAEEMDRMRRIVDDLLLLARLDEGMPLAQEAVEVELIAREAVLRGMLHARRQVSVDMPPGLYARADADRLLQVLTNLVANAVRHAGDGAAISITARAAGDTVVLEVADSGEGIPAEELPYVFDRFYRGQRARGAAAGVGLGLSIAASLTQAMGGAITVRSTPGTGTVFTVRLPSVEPPESRSLPFELSPAPC